VKSGYLFKHNIDALLRARGQTRHDLAMWCRRTDAWLSKILGKDDRNLPMKYLDRIADFFGLATYQLFQPGITPLTERRHTERRLVYDRRIGAAKPVTVEPMPAADVALIRMFNALSVENRRRIESWIAALPSSDSARGTARPGVPLPTAAPPVVRSRRTRPAR